MAWFSQPSEDTALQLLAGCMEELRGIRVALECIALKRQRLEPSPDLPDEADFMAQTDEDFALLEQLAAKRQGPGADEVDLLRAEAEEEGEELPLREAPELRTKPPLGSFLPRGIRGR